jgi:hypothetical protein
VSIAAESFVEESAERRALERSETNESSVLWTPSGQPISATIHNLSASGCLVRTAAILPLETIVYVGNLPRLQRARVVHRDGQKYGCAFVWPETSGDFRPEESIGTTDPATLSLAVGFRRAALIVGLVFGPWALIGAALYVAAK